MNFSVTKNGKKLSKKLYTWDEKTRTFSTTEDCLVLNFSYIDGVTFNTGNNCTFDTAVACTFNTDHSCVFNTGSDCVFNTGHSCTFKTGFYCTFNTGIECVIIRRDVFEIIQLSITKIKLNGYLVKGFTIIPQTKTITIDNKNIEISIESFEQLKKSLID